MQGQTQISMFQMKNSPLSHHSQASETILEQNYLLPIGSREILKATQKKKGIQTRGMNKTTFQK